MYQTCKAGELHAFSLSRALGPIPKLIQISRQGHSTVNWPELSIQQQAKRQKFYRQLELILGIDKKAISSGTLVSPAIEDQE